MIRVEFFSDSLEWRLKLQVQNWLKEHPEARLVSVSPIHASQETLNHGRVAVNRYSTAVLFREAKPSARQARLDSTRQTPPRKGGRK